MMNKIITCCRQEQNTERKKRENKRWSRKKRGRIGDGEERNEPNTGSKKVKA